MKKMIDPSTIKVDTSNLAKLDMAKEGDTDYSSETFYSDKNKNSINLYTEIKYPAGSGIGIKTSSDAGKIRLGKYAKWETDGYNDEFWEIRNISYQLLFKRVSFGKKITNTYLEYPSSGDAWILTDRNVKTLFGDKSIYGTGNIDLYAHDITITKGTGKAFLTVYSSKNTNINSLDVLKTIAGATFTKSCTGYINSKVIVAITETSFLLADGTTEALTGATFVDVPAAI